MIARYVSRNGTVAMKPADKWAGIQLWDQDGNSRVSLGIGGNTAGLRFFGKASKAARMVLAMLLETSRTFVMTFNERGKVTFLAPKKR